MVQRLLAGEPVLYNRPADTLDSPMNTFGDSSRLSASIMTVAVCSGTSVIGALSVQSYTQNRYNPSDLQTLQRVADTLAPALERAYAEEALRQAHNELEMRVWQRTADLMETNRTLESEIATRKRIENVLEEREKSLSMLMRNLPGAAYRCRNDHGWTPEYISEGIHALTGYAWSDFVREAKVTYGSLIHPEDRQMVWSKVQEALASRVQYTIEYRIQDAAGQERWVWERGQGIAREGEAAVGLEGFLTDITDRKHAEEALRHSEERFRFAMEATRDGLWDWDIRTDVAYFSPGYYRMLGYEPNQFSMTGQMWLDLIHPDDRERTLKANMECIENRTTAFEVEFRMRTIAGEWKWILGRGRAISRDAGGRAIRVIGTHVDTTERKQTEELLRTSEAKYRTLVQNIPGMVYRAYPDWTAEIISNAETLCGYTGDEVNAMEHGWLDIIHPEDRDAAVRDGAPWRLQAGVAVQVYRIIAKSGQVKWVEDHKISLFSESGSFMGIDGVVLDITGRKQTEQALRRSRRDLARLSRDREKLLEEERIRISRHLHDELGQSLTFLMLELSRFEKRVQESDPALSEELKQTCGQAKRMIESVRTIARSLRPIAIEHDGLVPSLRSCVEEFQRVSGVACRFVCRLPDARIGEPVATALYRIVQECLTNVVRHANASRCHIQLTAAGAQLELRIQDDGKGANVEALHGHESLGIVGMKERASAVGGKLLVKNRIPSGVLVKARFPLALAPPIHE